MNISVFVVASSWSRQLANRLCGALCWCEPRLGRGLQLLGGVVQTLLQLPHLRGGQDDLVATDHQRGPQLPTLPDDLKLVIVLHGLCPL